MNKLRCALVTNLNGAKIYLYDNLYHRVNGPAIEYPNGTKIWYFYDKLHRIGGPAAEYYGGDKYWYRYGKLHREDGPAVEYADGHNEWWIDGKYKSTSYLGKFDQNLSDIKTSIQNTTINSMNKFVGQPVDNKILASIRAELDRVLFSIDPGIIDSRDVDVNQNPFNPTIMNITLKDK